jgi:hypothetical protein
MFLIIAALIWLLGLMLGMNCIRMGIDAIRHNRILVFGQSCAITLCARCAGIALVLIGLMLIYAVDAPLIGLPGARLLRALYLR